MPSITLRAAALVTALVVGVACARTPRQVEITPDKPGAAIELWQEPADITSRDLFHGAGGKEHAPPGSSFTFVAEDTTGYSPGFDVKDDRGIEWSVKTGPEAQTEVVASRILWAIGFHQPPTYYVSNWSLTGARTGAQQPGRFRPDVPGRKVVGDWPWHENPFVGSRELGTLIVANLVINSWDWKTSNNKIYELDQPIEGARRWFVVRDIGASFGKYTYPSILKFFRLRGFGQGTRNDLPGFEEQGFIKSVDLDKRDVDFEYRGIYKDVIGTVTPEHVRAACTLLSRLSDAQWRDAFRAAGYDDDHTARFTAKIKAKIAQGLSMTAGADRTGNADSGG
jgi:hypothetical protein